jgi:hypothetical protein
MMIAEEHIDKRALSPLELKIKKNFQETLWRVNGFDQMLQIIKNIKCQYITNDIDRIVLRVETNVE